MITLPSNFKGNNLVKLIEEIGLTDEGESVEVDFSQLRRITPVGLVMLTALAESKSFTFNGLDQCQILGYLERMDFLKRNGITALAATPLRRAASKGRFVPVNQIDHRVENMGDQIAECLAPGGENFDHELAGLYDFCWYAFTELANNVRQHSGGSGYVAAQTTMADGMVRIALADNGKGIRESLRNTERTGSEDFSDEDAIVKAMEAKISSKGRPTNEGVGLTLVTELIRSTNAWLLISSGNGIAKINRDGTLETATLPGKGYPGTLIGMVFDKRKAHDFDSLLTAAKEKVSLLHKDRKKGKFEQ